MPDKAIEYFYRKTWGFIQLAREEDWEVLKGTENVEEVEGGVRTFISLKTAVCLM
jgi:hypothetical protein